VCCTPAADAVVRDLSTGAEHHIGVADGSVVSTSWSLDSSRLVLTVARNSVGDSALIVTATESGRRSADELSHAPDAGCIISRAVFDAAGIAVIEECPSESMFPARLVQLDATGRQTVRRGTASVCSNGASLVPDAAGTQLLVSGTTTCGGSGAPIDVVESWDGENRRAIGRYVIPQQFVQSAVWR
jgi:hypothetical protein